MVPDPLNAAVTDDAVSVFQVDGKPLRGRLARLGADSLGPIIARHKYPDGVARLVGEAVALAALVGSSLKFDGRLMVQAEGNGPVSLLVGEYSTTGGLRGYARFDLNRWERLIRLNRSGRPHMPQVFGAGALALIMVHDDPAKRPYQGVVTLQRATLAECAEDYFSQSEQVPTKVALSVAELVVPGKMSMWRAGGMVLQKIAGDSARGLTDDAWEEGRALFSTLSDSELADPDLGADTLLHRLFHESGVRIESVTALRDECTCNKDRLIATLSRMPSSELRDLAEGDASLGVDCQFCNRHYDIPLAAVV